MLRPCAQLPPRRGGLPAAQAAARFATAALLLVLASTQASPLTPPVAVEGCNCHALGMHLAPVCTNSGLTVVNKCVALCQGLAIAHPGACTPGKAGSGRKWNASGGGGGARIASSSGAGSGHDPALQDVDVRARVGMAELGKYRSEGFTFVGRVRLFSGKARTPTIASSAAGSSQGSPLAAAAAGLDPAGGVKGLVARITRTGDLYMREAALAPLGKMSGHSPPSPRPRGPAGATLAARLASGARARRALTAVYGKDDRIEIDDHTYPASAVGFVNSGCTGTLIGPRTVLTAGHCIYDTYTRQWNRNIDFRPGLTGGGRHCHNGTGQCFGERTVAWHTAETFLVRARRPSKPGVVTKEDVVLDVAVIKFRQDLSAYGWLGFSFRCARTKYDVAAIGYPQTKRAGTQWFVPGQLTFGGCTGWNTSGIATSSMDVEGGQSGAALFSMERGKYYVRAVHSASNRNFASHRTVNDVVFAWLEKVRE